MVFLKEDGNLDIERIDKLTIKEHMEMIEELTFSQYDEYVSTFPINEGQQHTECVDIGSTIDDELKNGAVVFKDFINKKRKLYGKK